MEVRQCTTPTHSHVAIPVGQDAAMIAKRIRGCADVKAGDVGQGAPALASTATCTIDGHTVNVNFWSSLEQASLDAVFQQAHRGAYYAQGEAWTVTLGDDPILQYQLTNQADKLLRESFSGNRHVPPIRPRSKTSPKWPQHRSAAKYGTSRHSQAVCRPVASPNGQ
jgi:hypothetical protein